MTTSENQIENATFTYDDPVRVGMVGLGGHGHNMQRAAQQSSGVDVVSVFDIDEDESRDAASRLNCEMAPSYEALLAHDELEAVILVTPNALHREQTEKAFQAGKHVLVEKPIANTVESGRAMIEAAEKAGCILMVGHQKRRNRPARRTRQYIEEGRLGDIVSVEIHFSADNTRRMEDDAWRLRPEQCPLLPIMQLGIHAIDLMHYFLGPIRHVYAQTQSVTTPPGVTDSVVGTFQIPNTTELEADRHGKVLGTIVSNYCTPMVFDYHLAGTHGNLRCKRNRFWFRSFEDTDWRGEGPAETQDFREYEDEPHRLEMDAFGEAVRSDAVPETSGRVGLQALEVVEALQRSSEQRKPQQVPLLNRGVDPL